MGKRFLTALLAAAMLLSLAACGEKKANVQKIDWQAAPAYLPERVDLPVEAGRLIGCCTDGEQLYVLAEQELEGERSSTLFRVALADGTAEVLDGYQPPSMPEGAHMAVSGIALAPDGTLWTQESWAVAYYDLPEDFDEEREALGKYFVREDYFYHLRQLDPETGKELQMVDLSEAAQVMGDSLKMDSTCFALDGEGRIYLADTEHVAVLDSKGALLFSLEASLPAPAWDGSAGRALATLPDGTAAAILNLRGGKREVRTINPAAKDWGQTYSMPIGTNQLYPGFGGFLFFSLSLEADKLYAWEPGAETARELMRLSDVKLDSGLMALIPLEGGGLAAFNVQYNSGNMDSRFSDKFRLTLLSPTEKLPEDKRVKLIYGTIGANSSTKAKINAFNEENEEYVIEIRDYAEGTDLSRLSGDALTSARNAVDTRLYADIAAGNIPDIWDWSMPQSLYAKQGIFEDLWPWIEDDPDLGRENVMEHVLECDSVDGKLYRASSSFLISTVLACADVVGDRTSWTLEEVLDAYESLGPGASLFNNYMSSSFLLWRLISMDRDRYVDMDAGTCQFDTPEFRALLELCDRVPREEDYSSNDGGAGLREGRTLLWDEHLFSPSHILYAEALCAGPEALTDEYEKYLNENHVYPTLIDENGNWREKEAVACFALQDMERSRASGYLHGTTEVDYMAAASGAAFGALEGGGYVSYVGYPSERGAGSSFQLYDSLAMSASCQHKEGAWAYIRQVLLPGGSMRTDTSSYGSYTYSPGFAINKADFEASMSPKWFTNKSGEYILDKDGQRVEMPGDMVLAAGYPATTVFFDRAPNEAQRERFMELYNAIDRVEDSSMPEEVYNIISEESEAYFAGDKTVDEAAAMIQSRVGIYVNEQR